MPSVTTYSEFEDNRVKHMEMIQGVIARLGTDSFLVKGWAVTVAAAFWGFAVSGKEWGLALASLPPTILFWWLDAYFLRTERLFRGLHEAVRTGGSVQPFFMSAKDADLDVANTEWPKVIFSLTLSAFYGALVVAGAVVLLVVK